MFGALLSAGSSLLGSALSAKSASDANQANKEMSREQMAFQERMSNTAYQRGMKDMQKAGLNPMLAYSQGGASAPAGASAVMQPVIKGNPLGEAVNSALALQKNTAEIDVMRTQADKNIADAAQSSAATAKINEETKGVPVSIEKMRADTQVSQADEYLKQRQSLLTQEQTNVARNMFNKISNEILIQKHTLSSSESQARIDRSAATLADTMEKINSTNFGQSLTVLDRIMQSVGLTRRATDR